MLDSELLIAGSISGVFGVKGWVKIFSATEPRENILRYSPWLLRKHQQEREIRVIKGQRHGGAVIAELEGVTDRDTALALIGADIFIRKQQLPKLRADEYYWSDLIGLEVKTSSGVNLGKVEHLMETGANDVLVVTDGETERLIPFLQKRIVLNI
ncbi:MAG: ribosome maturation factor RimM, partial [Methylomonas sp.]